MHIPQEHQNSWFYLKATLAVVTIVVLVIVGAKVAKSNFGQGNFPATISVSGKGEIKAVPDVSRFAISVQEKAVTQPETLAKTSEKINAVIAGLKDLGIEEKDIKTEQVSTYPDYEYVRATGEQKLIGYVSSHTLSVKVRTLELVPAVQQLFADQKITNVSGPELSVDDTDMLQDEARDLAIVNAKEQANLLAKQLGVRLGKIVSFNEMNDGGFAVAEFARSSMAPAGAMLDKTANIATGEQTITSNVSVTYRIK